MEKIIEEIIEEIVEQINKMIPLEWDIIQMLGEVEEGKKSYSAVFYFQEKNSNEYIYCYDIPQKYGISEDDFDKLNEELYDLIVKLYDSMNMEKMWDQVLLKIEKDGKINIDFRYDQIRNLGVSYEKRLSIWEYEQCGIEPVDEEIKDWILKMVPQKINRVKNRGIVAKSPEQFVASIKKYLPDIDSRLEKVDIDKVNFLEKMIVEQVKKCNNEIFELYQYINGEKIETVTLLMGGFTFLTIQQVIEEYKYFKSLDIILEECFSNCVSHFAIKKLCWIPFAYDSSNCYFAVDMTPGENGKIGQVIGVDLEYRKVYVLADSLNQFLGRIIGYMENGLCAVQQEGDDVFINAKSGHFFNSIEEMLH